MSGTATTTDYCVCEVRLTDANRAKADGALTVGNLCADCYYIMNAEAEAAEYRERRAARNPSRNVRGQRW